MREILPNQLWIGNAGDGRDPEHLLQAGIVAVINLAAEEPSPVLPRSMVYCHFPIMDGAQSDQATLRVAIQTLVSLLKYQVPTLVYCGAGMSRSPAVVATALSIAQGGSPEETLREIVAGQPHDVSPQLWETVKRACSKGMAGGNTATSSSLAGRRTAPMYERFTARARRAMQLANQEAQRFNHLYVGTEDILLGIVAEGSGAAIHVLTNLGVDQQEIIREVERIGIVGDSAEPAAQLSQTPRAKKVIECAMEEARNLDDDHVGTEHVLLGLLRDEEGLAAQVLMKLSLQLERVRAEIRAIPGRADAEKV